MKNMHYFTLIIVLMLAVCCKKEEIKIEDQDNNPIITADTISPALIKKLNIDSAVVLLTVKTEQSGSEIQKLYMISKDESLKLVNIETDTDTSFYLNNSIDDVHDIDDSFFAIKTYNGKKSNYIVSKKTGVAYSVDEQGEIDLWIAYHEHGEFSSEAITSDKYGNIYYIDDNENSVLRLNVSDLNNISSEIASVEGENVSKYFAVDDDGNVVYQAYNNNTSILRAVSYDKSEIKQLPGSTNQSWNYRFRGSDGSLYYDYNYMSKITFNPYNVSQYLNDGVNSGCGYNLLRVKNKKTDIAVGGCTSIAIIDHNNASIQNINYGDWDINDIIKSKSNNDYYFIAFKTSSGSISLSMIDPINNNPTALIENQYEILDFDATSNNSVYFKAFNTETGKNIIGRVNEQKDIKIIESNYSNKVTFLAITNLE